MRCFSKIFLIVLTAMAGSLPVRSEPGATPMAAIESVTRLTVSPVRYGPVDFIVMVNATWTDPYRSSEIALDLDLTSPAGQSVRVPCYYESGQSGRPSVWHARYAPGKTGQYEGVFVLTTGAGRSLSEKTVFSVGSSANKGFLHSAGAWAFRFDDGETFRGIGENLCWESRINDDSLHQKSLNENPRYNYEYMLGQLSSQGGNFFRVWMCPWNLPLEWKRVGNTDRYQDDSRHFNASAVGKIDALVALAESTDTYFMLTLDSHGSLLGSGWKNSSYHVDQGGPAFDPADFFTSAAAKEQYRDRLRYLVARWGYSPRLAVWEFFNEIDNAMYDHKPARIPDDIVTAWHAEMSTYLKTLDPYHHLISTSVSHREVKGLNEIPSIDFNQIHIYKHTDSIPSVVRRGIDANQKPTVIGEFAYEWDWKKNFSSFDREMGRDFKRGLWLGLFSPTPILPMSWWWEYFDQRQFTQYLRPVQVLHKQMLAAGQGKYVETSAQWTGAASVTAFSVRCGETIFILLTNSAPVEASGHLLLPSIIDEKITANNFNPDTGETTDFSVSRDRNDPIESLSVPADGNRILLIHIPAK